MKIAIPSTMPDLDGMVENKPGNAACLLLIETDDMSYTSVPGPSESAGPGSGVQAVSMLINMGAEVVLTGYIAPYIQNALEKQGIKIITGVSGKVSEAVKEYIRTETSSKSPALKTKNDLWADAVQAGINQFKNILPMLTGVILLLGLFKGFVSEERLLSLFSGSALGDAAKGAFIGSILAGNPVNSYVIGKSLLNTGVSMAGVTALMLAWVNVGLIQLPAEAKTLGYGFAVLRNLAGFIMAVLISYLLFFMGNIF